MGLRELLYLSNVDINNIELRFQKIAELLFQEYCIKKGNDQYKFLEIEFYYYTKDFEDIITYPRNVSNGKWFFHDSGVDITFDSKCKDIDCSCDKRKPNEDYFGGILIRSLLKNDKELITGPLKCSWSLFDFIDAFSLEKEDLPLIVNNENEKLPIIATNRHIPIDEGKVRTRFGINSDYFLFFKEKSYRFYIKHPLWENISKAEYNARPW
ncbi:MAG: peptidylarginine deiminase-like enzyme [Bacteroidetes bacterium]|nr:peptidylarginine deiminase-like enzyme [Bacteroidota bacterium]